MISWIAKTRDGKTHDEETSNWNDIKDDVVCLEFYLADFKSYHLFTQTISLPQNMKEYVFAKTASADLSGQNIKIESRYIQCKIGNNIVRIRVNETTGNVSVEVE